MSKRNFDEELISSFKMKLSKSMDEGGILSLSAALVRRSGPIWLESLGYTDASKTQNVDLDTLFSLQSTTKTVTAVAFLLAHQEGIVNLDDRIIEYYPEFRMKSFYGDDEYRKITFRHLLSHTSSLPREARIGGCFSRNIPRSFEQHIKSVNNSWLQNPVGSTYRYSNIGMDLVPYLLEKITGMPYPEYIQKYLGTKLGIKYYWSNDEISATKNAAKGYLDTFEAHVLDNTAFGCGGAFISIKDHSTFIQFLLNDGKHNGESVLDSKYIALMKQTKNDAGGYGLGTTVNIRYGMKQYSHTGGGFGYGSEMYWLPDYNLGLAVLNNSENATFYTKNNILKIVSEFLKEFAEKLGLDQSKTTFKYSGSNIIDLPKTRLQQLEGRYKNNLFSFEIMEENENLYIKIGSSKTKLKPHNERAFTTETPFGIEFQLNSKEKPIASYLYHPYEGLLYSEFQGKLKPRRISKPDPNWKKYIGLYYYNYYYTEYNFTSLILDKDGYLRLGGSILYPHKNLSNIFETESGTVVILEEDRLFADNCEYTKMDNPVKFYQELVSNNPTHRAALPWIFDVVADNLKLLKQLNTAQEILNLKKEFMKNKK